MNKKLEEREGKGVMYGNEVKWEGEEASCEHYYYSKNSLKYWLSSQNNNTNNCNSNY